VEHLDATFLGDLRGCPSARQLGKSLVAVDQRTPESLGNELPDRGLAGAHQAEEHDMPVHPVTLRQRGAGCRRVELGITAPLRRYQTREDTMSNAETGDITGTLDKDYNIIWFTEQSLSNALRLETYISDAEQAGDNELAEFFRRAQGASRKGAEEGKRLLASRIAAA
jgi:hypothetical protein